MKEGEMKTKLSLFAAIVAGLTTIVAFTIAPTASAAPGSTDLSAIPVTGTTASGGTFSGTYDLTRFAIQNGQLVGVGTLSGTLTDATGAVVGTVTNIPVTIPAAVPSGSCQILDLTLGPLDLNLLGLVVHLDTVHLNITAQQGPGNLLGNLLCAVANLLNGSTSPTALQQIVNLLNQIVARL
jgi:hypothetical protein